MDAMAIHHGTMEIHVFLAKIVKHSLAAQNGGKMLHSIPLELLSWPLRGTVRVLRTDRFTTTCILVFITSPTLVTLVCMFWNYCARAHACIYHCTGLDVSKP